MNITRSEQSQIPKGNTVQSHLHEAQKWAKLIYGNRSGSHHYPWDNDKGGRRGFRVAGNVRKLIWEGGLNGCVQLVKIHWVVHLWFVYFSLPIFPWKAYAKFLSKRPRMTMPLPLPRPYFFKKKNFFFFGCTLQRAESSFTDQGLNPHLLQWKFGVLATGPPETVTMSPPLPCPHFWLHPNFAHSTHILFSNKHCWLLLVWRFCTSKSLGFQTSTQPVPSPNSSLNLNFCLSENSPLTNLCKITSSTTFVSLPFFIFPKHLPLFYMLWVSFFIHLLSF